LCPSFRPGYSGPGIAARSCPAARARRRRRVIVSGYWGGAGGPHQLPGLSGVSAGRPARGDCCPDRPRPGAARASPAMAGEAFPGTFPLPDRSPGFLGLIVSHRQPAVSPAREAAIRSEAGNTPDVRLLLRLTGDDEVLEIAAAASGCADRTAEIARSYGPVVTVTELGEVSRGAALNTRTRRTPSGTGRRGSNR
jgi:hypothetical protein